MVELGNRELYCSPPLRFGGFTKNYEEAKYVIIGVPLDSTGTYRTGTRFAPNQIRQASLNIECYSFRTGIDAEDLDVADIGDIDISSDLVETLRRVEAVTGEVVAEGKIPILIGGEHTLSLGAARALSDGLGILCFDSHLDLRDEYLGKRLSHATFMRRVCEVLGPDNVTIVGVRAASSQELKYADEAGVKLISTPQIRKLSLEEAKRKIGSFVSEHERLYVSIDMDALDPSVAPAVQNPEPGGLKFEELLSLLDAGCQGNLAAMDLVEVTPPYDEGITSIYAAKILMEALCYIERRKDDRKSRS